VKIGSYTYDAWGNCTVSEVSTATSLQRSIVRTRNPFRYRGYYYDTEIQLYYLQSRYYNPATGRFINADGYVNANGDLIGYNMYAYCSNNPIAYVDFNGESILFAVIVLGAFTIGGAVGGAIYANNEEQTGGEAVKSVLMGATLGLFAGGGVLAGGAAVLTLFKGWDFVLFGGTMAETFAIGAIAYNVTNTFLAALAGEEAEPIEYQSGSPVNIPSVPPTTPHPAYIS